MRKPELGNDPQAADQPDEWDDDLRRLYYEAPEQKQCESMQSMWRDGLLIRLTDEKSGEVMLTSQPLLRVFTISHERMAHKLERDHGGRPVGKNDVEAQAEKILNSIQESIQQHHGIVHEKDGEEEIEVEESERAKFCTWHTGFKKGFGNDGYVVGLFFSSKTREGTTHEVLSQWGSWGVRMETTATEFHELQERHEFCRENFSEDEFRSRFQAMTHEERLAEIQVLWTRGIEFEMTAPSSGTHYSSVGAESTFCVDYLLGLKPKGFQPDWLASAADAMTTTELLEIEEDTGERMQTIIQIEQAIQETVRLRGGEIDVISRDLDEDEDGKLYCGEGGCTMIACRFSTKEISDLVVKEVLDSWGMFDVTVDPDSRQLTLKDKVEEASLLAARCENDPEREQQLLSKKGPAFNELKDRLVNEEIAEWESTQEGTVDEESPRLTLQDKIEEAARKAACDEMDPEREEQLWLMTGPAFDELKDRIIDAEIAEWESTREGNAN
jgi:hypothetical protein